MYHPGERLAVTDGAFAGMSGVVITPEEAVRLSPAAVVSPEAYEGRACWVALSIFGRAVPVELPTEWVSPAE